MNPFSSNNSTNLDPRNQPIPATNPSPFKIFKDQTVPTPNKTQTAASFVSMPSSTIASNLASSGISNSFPALNSSGTAFTQNPVQTNPHEVKSSMISELEKKKNSILFQKRVQDTLNEWKKSAVDDINTFLVLTKDLLHGEDYMREIQSEILLIHNSFTITKTEKQREDESLDIMENEIKELNSAVNVIDKEFDRIFQNNGLYIMHEDKENIYSATNYLSKEIDETEKGLNSINREVNDHLDNEEPDDLEQIICNYIDTLNWIENASLETSKKVEEMKKKYKHLI